MEGFILTEDAEVALIACAYKAIDAFDYEKALSFYRVMNWKVAYHDENHTTDIPTKPILQNILCSHLAGGISDMKRRGLSSISVSGGGILSLLRVYPDNTVGASFSFVPVSSANCDSY